MAESRLVPSNLMLWPKIRTLVPDLKLLIYHLWATSLSSAGAWLLDLGAVASATNLSEAAILDALKVFESREITIYDSKTGEIFILDWFRFHKFTKPSQRDLLKKDIGKIQSLWIKEVVLQKINELGLNLTQQNINSTPQAPKKSEHEPEHPLKDPMPSDPDVFMAKAIMHCEVYLRGKEIKNPMGFFLKVHSRIKADGPTDQDMEDLQTYREFLGGEEAA